MAEIIDLPDIILYRHAIEILEKRNIEFDKLKLLKNPELCREVIFLLKSCGSEG